MSTVALACMDVLFTDDEMARCNTSGSKGFEQLDSSKLSFLFSALKNKFDSPMFGEKRNQIVSCINTKYRGKRRTLIYSQIKEEHFILKNNFCIQCLKRVIK